jgi:hypothetical protein
VLDGGQVAPHLLAGDLAVAQVEDVQQPEADLPALALAQEGRAVVDVPVPDRLVDDEVLSVESANRRDVSRRREL